jgi:hypothetical protein
MLATCRRLSTVKERIEVSTLIQGLLLLVVVAFAGAAANPAFAQAAQNPDAATVQAHVQKFGVGKSVKVQLVGGERVRGHIASIGETSFTVRLGRHKGEKQIPYAQVRQVKDPGALTWMLIGAAVAVIIIVVVIR